MMQSIKRDIFKILSRLKNLKTSSDSSPERQSVPCIRDFHECDGASWQRRNLWTSHLKLLCNCTLPRLLRRLFEHQSITKQTPDTSIHSFISKKWLLCRFICNSFRENKGKKIDPVAPLNEAKHELSSPLSVKPCGSITWRYFL